MYLNEKHVERDLEKLYELIENHKLGVITTSIESVRYPLLQSTHVPWVLDRKGGNSNKGILRGHIARANPHSKQLLECLPEYKKSILPSEQVSIIFTHALQSYISPRFYTATKPKDGKVVPTWNYAAVEVTGVLRIHDDSEGFLSNQFTDLTNASEPLSLHLADKSVDHTVGLLEKDLSEGWKVSDAPEKYITLLSKAILGIEIEIESIVGKFKMSQEMSKGDRDGVIAGFQAINEYDSQKLATLIEQCSI